MAAIAFVNSRASLFYSLKKKIEQGVGYYRL